MLFLLPLIYNDIMLPLLLSLSKQRLVIFMIGTDYKHCQRKTNQKQGHLSGVRNNKSVLCWLSLSGQQSLPKSFGLTDVSWQTEQIYHHMTHIMYKNYNGRVFLLQEMHHLKKKVFNHAGFLFPFKIKEILVSSLTANS